MRKDTPTGIIGEFQNTRNEEEAIERGILVHCWWECRSVQPLWKAVWRYLKKLKMDLSFDPAILFLGIYPKKPEALIRKNIHICTRMFSATLFTIAKICKQPSAHLWMSGWSSYSTFMQWNAIQPYKKKENFTLCNSMDGPGEGHAKWNEPVREREVPYGFTHMWNLMNKLN